MFPFDRPPTTCNTLALGASAGTGATRTLSSLQMMTIPARIVLAVALVSGTSSASAQTFEAVGTRAAGMGGAFVAVADDASAAYWNPAGFASGNYFSLVLDRTTDKVTRSPRGGAATGSGLLVTLGMPALGLSYYRLRSASLSTPPTATGSSGNPGGAGQVRLDTLITHHSGATLVQSIARGIAVGATLKVVRGIASSTIVPDGDRDALLARTGELAGKGTSTFDADVGVMVNRGVVKAGLTVRNLMQPAFETGGESGKLSLQRQARAGVAIMLVEGWSAAADLDLTRTPAPSGDTRGFSAGTEGRIGRKAFVRGGVRLNTIGARQPALAAGGSYAVMGSVLLDAQVTTGSDRAHRGWGIAARFVY